MRESYITVTQQSLSRQQHSIKLRSYIATVLLHGSPSISNEPSYHIARMISDDR